MNLLSSTHNPANPPPPSRLVLAIEDSDEDYESLSRCFRQSAAQIKLHRCKTGDRALAYLEQCLLSEPTSLPAFRTIAENSTTLAASISRNILKNSAIDRSG